MEVERPLVCTVCSTEREMAALEDEWRQLWESDAEATVFHGFDWVITWFQHYAGIVSRIVVLLCYQGDKLVALAPFYLRKGCFWSPKAGALMLVGTGEPEADESCTEYMGPIYAPMSRELREACDQSFAKAIISQRAVLSVECMRVRHESVQGILAFIGQRWGNEVKVQTLGSCYRMPANESEALSRMSSRGRATMRRKLRKLRALPDFSFEVAAGEGDRQSFLASLVTLHQQRWRELGRAGVFSSRRFLDFHESVSERLLSRNQLLLARLRAAGSDLAVVYVLCGKSVGHYYQGGVSLSHHATLSPGLMTHLLTADALGVTGATDYDLMMSSSPDYKRRIADRYESLVDVVVKRHLSTRLWIALTSGFDLIASNR